MSSQSGDRGFLAPRSPPQVRIFQSLSAVLSLRSPRHANLIFCSETLVLGRSGLTPKGAL
jgi:hypothetical protein